MKILIFLHYSINKKTCKFFNENICGKVLQNKILKTYTYKLETEFFYHEVRL